MDKDFILSDSKLQGYLKRIDYNGNLFPDYQVLEALHLSHVRHIPFENIDAFLGRTVRVDLNSIHKKLVVEKRGGYCFEQNILFAAVLLKIGFKLDMLAARVVFRANRIRPRTHMMLLVKSDKTWLADVGFGAYGLVSPIMLESGETSNSFCRSFRVDEENGLWRLSSLNGDLEEDLYVFTLERQKWIDYQMANHYTSTHPDAIFTRNLTVQTQPENSQIILADNRLDEFREGERTESLLIEEDHFSEILSMKFNIELQPDSLLALKKALFG